MILNRLGEVPLKEGKQHDYNPNLVQDETSVEQEDSARRAFKLPRQSTTLSNKSAAEQLRPIRLGCEKIAAVRDVNG
jgi:hypothetical protein